MIDFSDNRDIFLREGDATEIDVELELYLERLSGMLDDADWRAMVMDYWRGLMLPIKGKSVEPRSSNWCMSPRCAGALSVTTGN